MTIFDAIILGIVEGITEFLPVSSTAHLILTAQLLGIDENSQFFKSFNIIIQVAPILAVLFIYLKDLFASRDLIFKLIVAFIPVGFVGFFFHDYIESLFTADITIIAMFLTGAIFIILETLYKDKKSKITNSRNISYREAIVVGIFQIFSLIPGVSRSGMTILGGLSSGMSREIAVKFSFLLALPTMGIASGYIFLKEYQSFTTEGIEILLIGFLTSFIFGWISVKTFLKIVSKFGFIPFGVYLFVTAFLFLFLN
jgi:undecaprenyl-diphosphatase